VHEFGSPYYNRLLPENTRNAGSRAVIVIDVHKVGTVSTYAPSLPFPSRDETPHCSRAAGEFRIISLFGIALG
jgi:hypothetical protein